MTTDVPLIAAWSLALFAWVRLLASRRPGWAVLLGVALGLGFLAKYAMAWFILCLAVHAFAAPQARRALGSGRVLAVAVPALALLAPNLLWNARHGWASLGDAADNAGWGGDLFHPARLAAFAASQIAVFGPILLAAFLAAAGSALARRPTDGRVQLLLCFSLPVLAGVAAQALASHANANWAAVAWPAATILVMPPLLGPRWAGALGASFALHGILAVLIAAGPVLAPALALPMGLDPYSRQLGWRHTATTIRGELERRDYAMVLTDDREVAAELAYYLRDEPVSLAAWRPGSEPRDHFQATRGFTGADGPVLLVTFRPHPERVTAAFAGVEAVAVAEIQAGPMARRTMRLFRLDGYAGR
jgi:hypothetical protein